MFIPTHRRWKLLILVLGGAFFAWNLGAFSMPEIFVTGAEGFAAPGDVGLSPALPRLAVLELDTWRRSIRDGRERPVTQLPPHWTWRTHLPFVKRSPDLLQGAIFTPDAYLQEIERLGRIYSFQRDILMYYGAMTPRSSRPNALNFNSWSVEDLRRLHQHNSRPFIGLETFDLPTIRFMAERLKSAGYGPLDRVYVRIGSEPSYEAYGTEDGTPQGKRHTKAAYAAYRRRFISVSSYINALNRRLRLDMHTVFAGTSREDFEKFCPPAGSFDELGFDLYVTPENKDQTLQQLRILASRYPYKPLVIPEFGIATAGPARWFARHRATPAWARGALQEVLAELSRHPAGVQEMTVFSVNVAERVKNRRWSWAWTPTMFAMLKEWRAAPKRWTPGGFHRYDPLSYPMNRCVLFLDKENVRIVYRRLPGAARFEETQFFRDSNGRWRHAQRMVSLDENAAQ